METQKKSWLYTVTSGSNHLPFSCALFFIPASCQLKPGLTLSDYYLTTATTPEWNCMICFQPLKFSCITCTLSNNFLNTLTFSKHHKSKNFKKQQEKKTVIPCSVPHFLLSLWYGSTWCTIHEDRRKIHQDFSLSCTQVVKWMCPGCPNSWVSGCLEMKTNYPLLH